MHAAVRPLYREGIRLRFQAAPIVGQLATTWHKGVPILNLWPLSWSQSDGHSGVPLAVLWHPTCIAVGYSNIVFRGLEATPKGQVRRWASQKWLCDVLTPQAAQNYFAPDRRFGSLG